MVSRLFLSLPLLPYFMFASSEDSSATAWMPRCPGSSEQSLVAAAISTNIIDFLSSQLKHMLWVVGTQKNHHNKTTCMLQLMDKTY